MHIQTDRALIPAGTPSVRHLTITITAPGRPTPAKERPPIDVALVLDRSGSMDGEKIGMARAAVAHAIKLLDARDRLSLVVYDDRVDSLVESEAASASARKRALERLSRVDARGSTNLSGGWFRGIEHLQVHDRVRTASPGSPVDSPRSLGAAPGASDASGAALGAPGAISRVLLLTDGLANQGMVDHDELAQEAARFRQQGIATSTFGVGADFDETLLSRLATEGGGHFYFIEKPRQIPDFLTSELGETLDIVADDVILDITCSTGMDAMVLNGFAVDATPGRVRVKLGGLVADQEITLAVAVSMPAHPLESHAFIDCRVTDRNGVLYPEPMRVEWRAADGGESERQPTNNHVLVCVAEVLAERARVTALAANRRGDYDEARRVVRDIIQHLRTLASGNRRIVAIIDRLRVDELDLGRAMTPIMMKVRHFASHNVAYSRDPSGKARRR